MAKRVFIFRDENVSNENFDELQSEWLDDTNPDKTVIGGEENDTIIVNEENTAMMVMEYILYNE